MRSTHRGALRGSQMEAELRPEGWLMYASGVRVRYFLNEAIEWGWSRS